MEQSYDLYCKFDLEKNKAKYVDYLEVMILPDGSVEYAIPSHTMKAEKLAAQTLGLTVDELKWKCPREFWCDYMVWLLGISGAVAVWTRGCQYRSVNAKQIATLRRMKLAGVYKGALPSETSEHKNKKIKENS